MLRAVKIGFVAIVMYMIWKFVKQAPEMFSSLSSLAWVNSDALTADGPRCDDDRHSTVPSMCNLNPSDPGTCPGQFGCGVMIEGIKTAPKSCVKKSPCKEIPFIL